MNRIQHKIGWEFINRKGRAGQVHCVFHPTYEIFQLPKLRRYVKEY